MTPVFVPSVLSVVSCSFLFFTKLLKVLKSYQLVSILILPVVDETLTERRFPLLFSK